MKKNQAAAREAAARFIEAAPRAPAPYPPYPRSSAVGYSMVPSADDSELGKPSKKIVAAMPAEKLKSSQQDDDVCCCDLAAGEEEIDLTGCGPRQDAPLLTSEGPPSPGTVSVAIGAYVTVSLSIVYFNWWLFTSSFRFPVFVSWLQQLIGFVAVLTLSQLGKRYSAFARSKAVWPRYDVCVRVLPLTLSFVGMVGLANICLKFVQVSTYQVARSLTILFTMALSYAILGERQRRPTVAACGVMVLGFIVGSLDTSTLSFGGVLAGGFSSAFQALYNVAIKRTLVYVNNDPNSLLFYNLILSSFLFIPVIFLAGESAVFDHIIWRPSVSGFYSQWASLFVSGILATLVNLTSYWCIKVTSPLTFNIVGFTKSVLQSVGGIAFLGDRVSFQSLTGIVLSLVGSGWYSQIKVFEAAAKSSSQQQTHAPLSQKELPDLESPGPPQENIQLQEAAAAAVSSSSSEWKSAVGLTRGASARGVAIL